MQKRWVGGVGKPTRREKNNVIDFNYHYPTERMLGKFVEWEQTGYGHILGIDIACDIPSNHEHIHQDHKTAEWFILQRWRRSTVRRVRQNDTIYFNRNFACAGELFTATRKRGETAYSTLHIELRLRGGRTILRRVGKA